LFGRATARKLLDFVVATNLKSHCRHLKRFDKRPNQWAIAPAAELKAFAIAWLAVKVLHNGKAK
jgi:hypothetical protein